VARFLTVASAPYRPDVSIIPFEGKVPQIADSAFIAPGVRIIGDVVIGEDASIWYNCVLRGDTDRISIGARSNIQDGTVIHADPGVPTIIGDDVLVGHMVMLHGCTLHDRAFVGLCSVVMNRCVIEGDGMLAARALLTEGKQIGARELWGGSPARLMRELDDAAVMAMSMGTAHYVQNGKRHAAALAAK
jgi:gamma-carbonic anhydrase